MFGDVRGVNKNIEEYIKELKELEDTFWTKHQCRKCVYWDDIWWCRGGQKDPKYCPRFITNKIYDGIKKD